jgi:hypothetical protein
MILKRIAPGMNIDKHENNNVLYTISISGVLSSEQETFVVRLISSLRDMLSNEISLIAMSLNEFFPFSYFRLWHNTSLKEYLLLLLNCRNNNSLQYMV